LNVLIALLWSFVGIPTMILLATAWGSLGVAAGRTLAMAAGIPVLFYAEHKFLGGIRTGVWLGSLLRLTVAGILLATAYSLLFYFLGPYALLVAPVLGGAMFVLTLVLTRYLSSEEQSDILALLPFRTSNRTLYE